MRPLNAIALASAVAIWVGSAVAQQPDPNQQLFAEWQALQLQQGHAEAAINRLVAGYEARLQTAMQWLKAAQQQANDTH